MTGLENLATYHSSVNVPLFHFDDIYKHAS